MRPRTSTSEFRTSTPQEREAYQALLREVEKDKPELLAEAHRTFRAIEEPTFSGELRRAILACDIEREVLVSRMGITDDLLNDFMGGDASLPSQSIDRLLELLGYRLTKAG